MSRQQHQREIERLRRREKEELIRQRGREFQRQRARTWGPISIIHKLTDIINNLTDGLVLWLPLDDGIGDACDHSGLLNHGTIDGAAWANGKFGKALSFDGINDHVEILNSPSLNPTKISISAWVYPTLITGASRQTVRKGVIYQLFLNGWSGNVLASYLTIDGVLYTLNCNTPVSLNTWHHLVVTYDGSYIRMYLDGVLDRAPYAISGSIDSSADTLTLAENNGFGEWFQGVIDEVRIYNRALSQAEITALYNLP